MVVFQESLFDPNALPVTGSIRGTVVNGAGRTILLSGSGVNASTTAGSDGSFGFDLVAAGTYTVSVASTSVSAQVTVVAGQQANVTLTVPVSPPPPDEIAELRRQIAVAGASGRTATATGGCQCGAGAVGNVLTQIKQIVGDAGY
jgi:hypothetical protein